MRTIAVVALLVAGILLPGPAAPVEAYEADVHYAWTYYLALHLGYTKRQAFQLASAAFAVDTNPTTGPMEAGPGEVLYGARHPGLGHPPNPRIAEIWVKFHAFQETNYIGVPGMVDKARQQRLQYLWGLAKSQGNPGLAIHFVQDLHSHKFSDNVRGHAFAGHGPDYLGTTHDGKIDSTLAKDRDMTRDTLHTLSRFLEAVLLAGDHPFVKKQRGRLPRPLGLGQDSFVWTVLGELARVNQPPYANPLGGLSQLAANYTLGVGPKLDRAVAVVNRAIDADERAGRLPPSPFGARPDPAQPLPGQWYQYVFDGNGVTSDPGYRVENLTIEVVRTDVKTGAGQGATLAYEYRIGGVARHPQGPLRFVERHEIMGAGGMLFQKEKLRLVPHGQPLFEVKDELPVNIDARAVPSASPPQWRFTLHIQGIPPEIRTVPFAGSAPTTTARNCDGFKPLCAEKCKANCLDMGSPLQWCENGCAKGTPCGGVRFTIEQVKLECYDIMKARCEAGCTPKEKGSCVTKARSVCRCHKENTGTCAPSLLGQADGRWLARTAGEASMAWLGWAVTGAVRPWLPWEALRALAEPCRATAGAEPQRRQAA